MLVDIRAEARYVLFNTIRHNLKLSTIKIETKIFCLSLLSAGHNHQSRDRSHDPEPRRRAPQLPQLPQRRPHCSAGDFAYLQL
jgi:hypothetical protein